MSTCAYAESQPANGRTTVKIQSRSSASSLTLEWSTPLTQTTTCQCALHATETETLHVQENELIIASLYLLPLVIMTVDSYYRLKKAKEFSQFLKEAAR